MFLENDSHLVGKFGERLEMGSPKEMVKLRPVTVWDGMIM